MEPIDPSAAPDAILHFSVTVSDLQRSIAWYEAALGLVEISRQRSDNRYVSQIVDFDGVILEVAFLELPGTPVALELIEYVHPRGEPMDLPTNVPGVAHLALQVADIDRSLARIAAAGVKPLNPPVEIDHGANLGARACYLRDPDGFTIELVQPPAGRNRD